MKRKDTEGKNEAYKGRDLERKKKEAYKIRNRESEKEHTKVGI